MNSVEVRIPKPAMSMKEGHLVELLVADGQRVETDAGLCILETDKVEQEIPAPATGTVRWVVAPDETYEVGTLVAEIDLG